VRNCERGRLEREPKATLNFIFLQKVSLSLSEKVVTDYSATPKFNCYNRYQPVGPVKVARPSPRGCMPSMTCEKWREKYVSGPTGGSAPEISLLTQISDTVSSIDQC
jgi:hypothetical protein